MGRPHIHAVRARATKYERSVRPLDDDQVHPKMHKLAMFALNRDFRCPAIQEEASFKRASALEISSAADEEGNSLFVPIGSVLGDDPVRHSECVVRKLKWPIGPPSASER